MVFKLAIDTVVSSWKKISVSVFMMIVSLLLFLFTVIVYKGQRYAEQSCEDTLTTGVENTGFLRIEEYEYNFENAKKFNSYVNTVEEVLAYGNYVSYGIDAVGLEKLQEIQIVEGILDDDNVGFDIVKMNCMNGSNMKLCDISLSDGIMPEMLTYENEEISYLYLGYEYRDIPVGTVFEGNVMTYIVAGIIEKGQRYIIPDLSDGFSYEQMDYSEECDYIIYSLRSNSKIYSDTYWISVKKDYDFDMVLEKVVEKAKEEGLLVTYTSLDRMIENDSLPMTNLLKYVKKLIIIVSIATILIIVCNQVMIIYENMKQYGILVSVGFSTAQIKIMILIVSGIMLMVSVAIAVMIMLAIAKYGLYTTEYAHVFMRLIYNDVIPSALIMGGMLLGIPVIVTQVALNKLLPIELIKSNS